MFLLNLNRRSWHLILASAVVIALTPFYQPGQASAQVLNDKVNQLLEDQCFQLTGGQGNIGFGPNLTTLCAPVAAGQTGGQQAASAAGGGAASVQGSAASILNRLLLQRMYETDEEESQAPARSSSMRLNPVGSLLSGFGLASSVSSPFYAATTAGGGSTASFTSSSQRRWWGDGLGFFASGQVESLNRDVTTFQNGYTSNILGIAAGADYRFSKRLVTGLALSYSNTDGDFRNNGGNFSTNSYGGTLFASYLPTDRIFMQVTGGYTRNNYLVARAASATITDSADPSFTFTRSGLASSNSNGNVFNLGLMTGYDHPIGRFTIGPRAGVNYSNTKIGNFTENGSTGVELKYDDQWINSLQSVLGVQGSAAVSTGLGILVSQVNADYIHEFANSQRFIHVQFAEDLRGTPGVPGTPTKFAFQNDVPVRNYFNLGTGFILVLPYGWQPFVNFRAMVGNTQFDNYAGTFGIRIEL